MLRVTQMGIGFEATVMPTAIVYGAWQGAMRRMVGKRLSNMFRPGARELQGLSDALSCHHPSMSAEGPPGSKNSGGAATLLLDSLYSFRTYLLVLNLRGIPTSAERLDQIDRQDHLLAE